MLIEKALKIRWQDKIPYTEVLKKTEMQSVHTLLKVAQLRWTGHVTRMLDERQPKKFYMENFRNESALKVATINATKTPLKHRLRISTFQLSPWNRLHRIGHSEL